jgi:hypothetical protein
MQVAETCMNETSSRSHSVYTIKLVHKRTAEKEASKDPFEPSEVCVAHTLRVESHLGSGFRVRGSGFGVWGLGFGVWGLGSGVWGLGSASGVRICGLGAGVWGPRLGVGICGLGFGV